MDTLTLRQCSVDEFESLKLDALFVEYARESRVCSELGEPNPQYALYRQLESTGGLFPIVAFYGSLAIGFFVLVVSPVPHFGAKIGTAESFFVDPSFRKTGAGLALLNEASRVAAQAGAVGLYVSAPVGSRLEKLLTALEGKGFRKTNTVFFRGTS
jgi:GNAT superfamily N-acetyltransferase